MRVLSPPKDVARPQPLGGSTRWGHTNAYTDTHIRRHTLTWTDRQIDTQTYMHTIILATIKQARSLAYQERTTHMDIIEIPYAWHVRV